MKNFYVTFGYNTPYRSNFFVVKDADSTGARKQIFAIFGSKWAFMYDEEDFKGMPEKYGLSELRI